MIVCVFVCWLCYEGERPRSGLSNGSKFGSQSESCHIGNETEKKNLLLNVF